MWIKGIFLLLFALFIDGVQIAIGWMFLAVGTGLQALTPVGGAAGGALAGAYLCWNTSAGVVAGIISSAKCTLGGGIAGAVISAFGLPIGTGLGFIVDICISLTLGSGLIMALIMSGMFYPGYVTAVFVGEALPGLDVLPGWTFLVVRSVLKKSAEEGSSIAQLASGVASAVLSPTSATSGLGTLARGISNVKSATGDMARSSPLVNAAYESGPVQNIARQRTQLASEVGREITSRPPTPNNPNLHAKTA